VKRVHRYPRCAEFGRTPKSLAVWTIGGAIALFLLAGVGEIVVCGIEEELKPERICYRCALNSGVPIEGDEFYAITPNRTCSACRRVWGDYRPYYLRKLRDPLRDEFGIVHF